MTTKFTKGPWLVKTVADAHTPMRFWGTTIEGPRHNFIAQINEGTTNGTQKANADLIASAPDLYEALESLLCFAKDYGVSNRASYEDWSGHIKASELALQKANQEYDSDDHESI